MKGYSLAQKMVGRACGLPEGTGVLPGNYCEPAMGTVGSQDTTGELLMWSGRVFGPEVIHLQQFVTSKL